MTRRDSPSAPPTPPRNEVAPPSSATPVPNDSWFKLTAQGAAERVVAQLPRTVQPAANRVTNQAIDMIGSNNSFVNLSGKAFIGGCMLYAIVHGIFGFFPYYHGHEYIYVQRCEIPPITRRDLITAPTTEPGSPAEEE